MNKKHKFFRLLPAYCAMCGTGEVEHKADGKCENCYMKEYRKRNKKLSPAKVDSNPKR